MAYVEVSMFEVQTVLERAGRGESISAISRVTGHARKTIAGYVRTAGLLGWEKGEAVSEELAGLVAKQHRPARESGSGDSQLLLLKHKDQIVEWLQPEAGYKRGLRLSKVHIKLERLGVVVPYSSLHRFARDYCGFNAAANITVRMADSEPGQYAQVDFGQLGYLGEPNNGRRLLWALIVTLPYNDTSVAIYARFMGSAARPTAATCRYCP